MLWVVGFISNFIDILSLISSKMSQLIIKINTPKGVFLVKSPFLIDTGLQKLLN